ncbi:armadillo-type protein [Phellopilus nigrolimitatus]|nr:armadillo-type protein [Phellopilus nigrolimitatus]
MQVITPLTKPQEWEDGEAKDISRFREAALTAIGALCLLESDIRNEVAGVLGLLPLIAVCLDHPYAGVRYGACLCVRALARSIRVLRTNLLDSGVGMTMCTIVEKKDEDRRVTNIALAGLCNLLNDFSPLRKTLLERGMVTRISELSRSQEDALRVSALWAIKNLLNKATTEEKQIIMSQLGWEHLKSCLVDPKEAIQEQALNILTNIASAENHIDMVFEHLSGYDLMQVLADALESPSEEVVSQASLCPRKFS